MIMLSFIKSIPGLIFKGIRRLAFGFGYVIGFVYYFCVGVKEELLRKDTITTNDDSNV